MSIITYAKSSLRKVLHPKEFQRIQETILEYENLPANELVPKVAEAIRPILKMGMKTILDSRVKKVKGIEFIALPGTYIGYTTDKKYHLKMMYVMSNINTGNTNKYLQYHLLEISGPDAAEIAADSRMAEDYMNLQKRLYKD